MSREILAAVGAIAVTALAPSAVANGNPPRRTTFDIDVTYVVHVCPFPVQIHAVATFDRKDWFDSSGRLIERHDRFPVAYETHTNLVTGESITLDTSGPGRWIFHPDGSATLILRGASTILLAWPDVTTPGLAWFFGNAELRFDPAGNVTLVSWHGRTRDLCAELA